MLLPPPHFFSPFLAFPCASLFQPLRLLAAFPASKGAVLPHPSCSSISLRLFLCCSWTALFETFLLCSRQFPPSRPPTPQFIPFQDYTDFKPTFFFPPTKSRSILITMFVSGVFVFVPNTTLLLSPSPSISPFSLSFSLRTPFSFSSMYVYETNLEKRTFAPSFLPSPASCSLFFRSLHRWGHPSYKEMVFFYYPPIYPSIFPPCSHPQVLLISEPHQV